MAQYIPMIDPNTGEIDALAIAERAPLRAAREWGGPDFPPSYLREATQWLTDRAMGERLCWRRDHGLPDDSVCSGTITPYGKQVQGVRRSAF
jgi:hypothetical protein